MTKRTILAALLGYPGGRLGGVRCRAWPQAPDCAAGATLADIDSQA